MMRVLLQQVDEMDMKMLENAVKMIFDIPRVSVAPGLPLETRSVHYRFRLEVQTHYEVSFLHKLFSSLPPPLISPTSSK